MIKKFFRVDKQTASQIFEELDAKFRSSGVYKKIAVRSLSHIRAKYGVSPKKKNATT